MLSSAALRKAHLLRFGAFGSKCGWFVFWAACFPFKQPFRPGLYRYGSSAQGYDNMALQYNRYIVYGVSIKIEFPINDLSSASGMSGLYYINSGNDGYSLASKRVSDVIENNMGGAAILNTDTALRSSTWDTAQSGQSRDRVMRKS